MVPSEQFSVLLVMEQLPCVVVAEVQVRPPLVGRASLNETLVAEALPAIAGLLTTMLKLAWPPMVKVPPLGDFTTLSCAGGGVQVSEPLSCAEAALSALAMAAGLGCDWQAPVGVGVGLETVTVTGAPTAMSPSEQLNTLLATAQ